MRTWILASLLYAVAAVGGDRADEPSYQFAERVVATAQRASPFGMSEQSERVRQLQIYTWVARAAKRPF